MPRFAVKLLSCNKPKWPLDSVNTKTTTTTTHHHGLIAALAVATAVTVVAVQFGN